MHRRAPRRCLSVVVPCFNEAGTVGALVDRVGESPWTAEIVVVDDGSTDGSGKVLADLLDVAHPRLRVITHERNRGKGAALRSAFAVVIWRLRRSSRTPTWSTTQPSTRCCWNRWNGASQTSCSVRGS